MLKVGGEMYFSDVYCSQRLPPALKADPMLWGECLSGALYWNDFLRLAKTCGFLDPRLMKSSPIALGSSQIEAAVGTHVKFFSATYRLWKLPALEPDCEDYGQVNLPCLATGHFIII